MQLNWSLIMSYYFFFFPHNSEELSSGLWMFLNLQEHLKWGNEQDYFFFNMKNHKRLQNAEQIYKTEV